MKKFLLSLLTVFAATSAFAATDTLNAAFFGSPSSYSQKSSTSTTTNVTYNAYIMTGTGQFKDMMQFNNKNNYSIYSSANPDGKIIKSITLTYETGGKGSVLVECDVNPYTSATHLAAHGVALDEITKTTTVAVENGGYKYFHIYSSNGACYIPSIEVEYVEDADPRQFVNLSFAEKVYNATLGQNFEAPSLTCDVEAARSAVIFKSSDETVATVDNEGNVTILDDGTTMITAYIAEDNTDYYANPASYDLIVTDPNAIVTTLNTDFFKSAGTGYKLYSVEDSQTKIEYTTDHFLTSSEMQYNTGSGNGVGSGIAVTATNPNYVISSINIEFSSPGVGVNVYKQNSAFAKQTLTTAISTTNASQIGETVTTSGVIAVGAPAFAIVPAGSGVIKVKSVEVTYAKTTADDGSVMFEPEVFKDYMICINETVELVLPEDAPEVTYTSSHPDVADIESGEIMALDYGTAEITATWDAVPGKWMAGSDKFTVYVKYATLADVLADALDSSTGFVHEGETYVGNFPVVVGSDNGKYNYVTDGTAWALFFVDHNHGEGAILEAGWSGKFTVRNGLPEFTDIQHSDIPDEKGEFTINTYDDLTIDENVLNEVMILNDVTFAENTQAIGNTYTGNYNGQEVTFYNQFDIDVVEAGTYNVKGAISTYKGNIQVYPIEYVAQAKTGNPSHVEAKLDINGQVAFTNVEEGAHVYYRHGGEDPDHTNVFTEPAQQQVKRRAVNTTWTYNHTTHPLTYTGEEMSVRYYAKAAGKAPSDVQTLAIDGNGNTTSIVEVSAVKDGEAVYDLMGRKVVTPVRGLYIQNGAKKFVR